MSNKAIDSGVEKGVPPLFRIVDGKAGDTRKSVHEKWVGCENLVLL